MSANKVFTNECPSTKHTALNTGVLTLYKSTPLKETISMFIKVSSFKLITVSDLTLIGFIQHIVTFNFSVNYHPDKEV